MPTGNICIPADITVIVILAVLYFALGYLVASEVIKKK